MMPAWARPGEGGRTLLLTLHVQPNARSTGPAGRHGDALRFRVAAPALDNRANETLIDYLRHVLDMPRNRLRLKLGATSRRKVVEIDSPSPAAVALVRAWDEPQDS